MCSSRSVCGGSGSPGSESRGSGAHYALCALGVGLIALGIVMIVWTLVPQGDQAATPSPGNATSPTDPINEDTDLENTKSSSVALVLVGAGIVMLLLSICLGLRSKRRARNRESQAAAQTSAFMGHVAGQEEESAVDSGAYNVPSYEEVVGSGNYPVRQSNLRQSTSQLPSYEDILAAVENEGQENTPLNERPPGEPQPAAGSQAPPTGLGAQPSLPTRSASRASRLLKPLRVRRIKSDKLHLKDFRLQIRTPTQNPVTIEPITPPPQYENKMPELQ